MEVVELIRQNVSVWDKVELVSAKALLHLDVIVTKSVFSSDLIALRKVIDSLVLIQALVEITFAGTCRPKQVPFVRLRQGEVVDFKNGSHQTSLAFQNFVEHLLVVDVVHSRRALSNHGQSHYLTFLNRFDCLNLVYTCRLRSVNILLQASRIFVFYFACSSLAIKKVLACARGSIIWSSH